MECGNTDDSAWNACQYQLIKTGRIMVICECIGLKK